MAYPGCDAAWREVFLAERRRRRLRLIKLTCAALTIAATSTLAVLIAAGVLSP